MNDEKVWVEPTYNTAGFIQCTLVMNWKVPTLWAALFFLLWLS